MKDKLAVILLTMSVICANVGVVANSFINKSRYRTINQRLVTVIHDTAKVRKLWTKRHLDFYGPCSEPCHLDKQDILSYDRECRDCHYKER